MILITRPKTEAIKFKRIVENLGHNAHIDSLSKIVLSGLNNNLNSMGIVLISSQHATKIFIKNYSGSKKIPLLVVGNTSNQKLIAAGFSNILHQAMDSNQILKYLKKNYFKLKNKYSTKLTYLTGSVANKKFIVDLKKIVLKFEKKVVYKTIYKKSFSQTTISLLKKNKICICLIYSQQNARHFCELINKEKLFNKCKNLLIITMSKNISVLLKKNGYVNVKNARYPTQKSLLSLIARQ